MRLAAIVYHNTQKLTAINYTPRYSLVKLFDDSSSTPVASDRIDEAIRFIEARGWQSHGYWLNDQPAIAWSPTPKVFEEAWETPILRCPCKFARRSNSNYPTHRVGETGYIVPTRSRTQVWRLRQRYPSWVYQGDLLMVPDAVLAEYKEKAERQWTLAQRAAFL